MFVKCSKKQNNLLVERGNVIMKKIVSIVVTTGLLMGTVAFSTLACDRGHGPERFPEQKKMGQHDRYQPPMEQQRNLKVITQIICYRVNAIK
jgi:hypothetical protein